MLLRKKILEASLRSALFGALVSTAPFSFPTVSMAQSAGQTVVLTGDAVIERSETGPDGKEKIVHKTPKDVVVVPGDRVIFSLNYVNKGATPATGFRATNPMPGPVQFVSAAEDWAEVSVDGGKSWGKLADLKVTVPGADGAAPVVRSASSDDVTHVRWVFANAIPPGGKGTLSYRGVIK